jgi:Family of unknown function (DUF6445)
MLLTSGEPDCRLNPNARIEVRQIGREGQPVVVVDDALASPGDLIARARRSTFHPPQHTRYPGLNAALPGAYLDSLVFTLRPLLADVFGIPETLPLTHFGFFALATAAPADLEPIQKIPHTDSPDPFRIASVHYLFETAQGGTAFFRHRRTGFESVDHARRADYVGIVSEELERMGGELTRHAGPQTPTFELVETVEAALNRLVVYRSNVLHSGLLDGSPLSADPATGRLTANSFFEVDRRTAAPR